jgi:adenine-specific DNA-methyltransferase
VNSAEPVRPGSNADLAGYATVADITRARLRAVSDTVGGGFEAQTSTAFAPQPPEDGT